MRFATMASTTTKATSSTTKVPLGIRKLLVAMGMCCQPYGSFRTVRLVSPPASGPPPADGRPRRSVRWLLLVQREDEQGGEGQVDEVHGLHQADGQEHDGEQPPLGLGLAGHAGDGLASGEAVADGRTDGAAAERQATPDHGAGPLG